MWDKNCFERNKSGKGSFKNYLSTPSLSTLSFCLKLKINEDKIVRISSSSDFHTNLISEFNGNWKQLIVSVSKRGKMRLNSLAYTRHVKIKGPRAACSPIASKMRPTTIFKTVKMIKTNNSWYKKASEQEIGGNISKILPPDRFSVFECHCAARKWVWVWHVWGQFHQHFMRGFFERTFCTKFFCA